MTRGAGPWVWFHRARAVAWVVAGVVAFLTGWADMVWFVTIASLYANVASDWASSEAADDRKVLDAVAELGRRLDRMEDAEWKPRT